MSRRDHRPTSAQKGLVDELVAIARRGDTPLLAVAPLPPQQHVSTVRLRLRTADISREPNGLPIEDVEEVLICILEAYPWVPPLVYVEHARFVGYTHVLAGTALCLYLDPHQEWHPLNGAVGFLDRLWGWFTDAAADAFDPREALFHPVGGVLHRDTGMPTLVARVPLRREGPGFSIMALHRRSEHRLDLVPLNGAGPGSRRLLVVGLHRPLRYGAGLTLRELLTALELPDEADDRDGLDRMAVLQAIGAAAHRNPRDEPQYFLLAVPADRRDPRGAHHLLAARLPAPVADRLAEACVCLGLLPVLGNHPPADLDTCLDTALQWCPVSEERPAMTIRRDDSRPVNVLFDTRVAVWGVGGLGSWIAEYLARSGVASLQLADPGTVTGGLLVRQNYLESDIGTNKAEALATYLRGVRDHLDVRVVDAFSLLATGHLPDVDVLVDATVNTSIAAAAATVWTRSATSPLVVRVATDRATSTLGLATITRPGNQRPDPEELDRVTGNAVSADPELESHRTFWAPGDGDELVAEPGCSVPTFHGAAADLAGLAAVLVNLTARHLTAPQRPGAQLIAMPLSPLAPAGTRWLPYEHPDPHTTAA